MTPSRKEWTRRKQASPNPAPRPAIGQPFNPWREICGFYPPDIVARQTDLGDGPKRLYERAVRWAGRNGVFWYSFERMGEELGKCPRQIKRDRAEMEKRGLVTHERRGKRQSNVYRFLYHPMFDGEVTSLTPHLESEVTDLPGEGTSMSPGDVTRMSHESFKENFVKESSSEDVGTSASSATKERTDDRFFF